MKKVLITCATRSGSTSEVAEAIGKEIAECGTEVVVRPVVDVDDISSYDAVIVGGPILYGKCPPEVRRFLTRHEEGLSQMLVACFLTCLRLTRIADEVLPPVPLYIDPSFHEVPKAKRDMSVMERSHAVSLYLNALTKRTPGIRPLSVAVFNGKLDFGKLDWLSWLAMKLMTVLMREVQEGDFRNWEAIRSWAASLCPALVQAGEKERQ